MPIPDIDTFYNTISERIQFEREKREMTLEDLGTHLGISRAAINNLEKKRNRPSLYQLLLIAEKFGIHYTDLIGLDKKEGKKKKLVKAQKIEFDEIVADKKLDKQEQTYVTEFINNLYKNKK